MSLIPGLISTLGGAANSMKSNSEIDFPLCSRSIFHAEQPTCVIDLKRERAVSAWSGERRPRTKRIISECTLAESFLRSASVIGPEKQDLTTTKRPHILQIISGFVSFDRKSLNLKCSYENFWLLDQWPVIRKLLCSSNMAANDF